MRIVLLSGRGRRMKAAAVGALALPATLLLGITPAQAAVGCIVCNDGDHPQGGGGAPDPLLDPGYLYDFLSRCGEYCTIVSGEYTGDPHEGNPERVSEIHDNCTPRDGSFTYKMEETKGNGTIIDLSLNGIPAPVLPKIQYSSLNTKTEGVTDTVTQSPYTRSWLDRVPVTQKLRGTWHLTGPANGLFPQMNEFNTKGPRDFTDVEADATYTVLRKQSRAMTEEEKATLCNNKSAS
ncbi:hypothetical protein ACWCYK_36140 [Streptomyces lydicamycinicus]|nr:hypothetical protein [Streptomyces lydicamycinicus]